MPRKEIRRESQRQARGQRPAMFQPQIAHRELMMPRVAGVDHLAQRRPVEEIAAELGIVRPELSYYAHACRLDDYHEQIVGARSRR